MMEIISKADANKSAQPKLQAPVKVDNRGILQNDEKLRADMKKHLIESEGVRDEIYIDPVGVPTVGSGYALAKKKKNDDTKKEEVILYSKEKIDAVLTKTGNTPLTDAQYAQMQEKVNAWNTGDDKQSNNLKDSKIDGYKITNQEALLEDRVTDSLRRQEISANNRELDLRDAPYEVKLAAADGYYRGGENLIFGEGHRNTEAFRNKNYGAFAGEVQYGSNKEGLAGVDKRNTIMARAIVDNVAGAQTQINVWKTEHPDSVYKVEQRHIGYKKDPRESRRWAREMDLAQAPNEGLFRNGLAMPDNEIREMNEKRGGTLFA